MQFCMNTPLQLCSKMTTDIFKDMTKIAACFTLTYYLAYSLHVKMEVLCLQKCHLTFNKTVTLNPRGQAFS
jgi:hypothetical protein